MGKHRSALAKNATYLTLASILQKAITFGYYGYLASSVGTTNLGKYTFALTVSSIFVIFMDFGLGTLLTREVAKEKDSKQSLEGIFNRFFSAKLVLMSITILIFIILIHSSNLFFTNIDTLDVQLLYIAMCIIIFDTLSFSAFSVLRALQQLRWEAYAIILYQSTIVVFGVTAIYFDFPLTVVLSALLVGSVVQSVFIWAIMKKVAGIRLRIQINRKDIISLITFAAPFAIAGIIFRLTGSIDAILIKLFLGDESAGFYGLAFKLTFALMVIPGSYATSYYPAISNYIKYSPEKTGELFEKSLLYMLVVSFPIMGGVFIIGDTLITTVWENFTESIVPLYIFMASLPFLFLNYPIGNLLNAANKQKKNTRNMFIALIVNILFNFLLIPFYGIEGSAFAATLSAVVLVCIGFPDAYKHASFPFIRLVNTFFRVVIATLAMMIAVFYSEIHLSLIFSVCIGAIIYSIALFVLRVVSFSEIRTLFYSVTKKV